MMDVIGYLGIFFKFIMLFLSFLFSFVIEGKVH